ncbi:MAG: type II toxin-antitoxin system RatA family toxin [Alphaproteobacteria bacterium]|nr:type II toxin-antitoxin system RatA family toxin [Alphaproteobacteria bacterium]
MPQITERRELPFRPADMFAFVADIERYSEFLKWCDGVVVHARESEGDRKIVTAEMNVRVKMFTERFLTRVTLDAGSRTIEVDYIEGPFKRLVNRWTFEGPEGGPCIVGFWIDFEFRKPALRLFAGVVLHEAVDRLVSAFVRRAYRLYDPTTNVAAPAEAS